MMDWNNKKKEFPKMPDDMRKMVEREVERQIKMETVGFEKSGRKRKISFKKIAVVAAAATLTLGTTVFAGTKLYQIYSEKAGIYGLKTYLGNAQEKLEVPAKLPEIEIKKNYIPKGMINPKEDPHRIAFEENRYEGGISMMTVLMDQKVSSENFLFDANVTYSENLNISGHDAVYLEIKTDEGEDISYVKRFYVAYPEVWRVLQVYVGSNVTKEEAMKVVENIELVSTGEVLDEKNLYTWSEYVKEINTSNEEILKNKTEGIGKQTASEKEMANMHTIGQGFAYGTGKIEAKVADVQVSGDLSLLAESEYISEELKKQADADGNLLPGKINYLKAGNGVDTVDEVIRTEEVDRKLVYVGVEFTNTGDEELKDICFMGIFVNLLQQDNGYKIYNRSEMDNDEQTDFYTATKNGGAGEMQFYDVHDEVENKNYISELKPGETVVVHMARIMNEDELPYLYLSLSAAGGTGLEFTEDMLEQGFVDIRQ